MSQEVAATIASWWLSHAGRDCDTCAAGVAAFAALESGAEFDADAVWVRADELIRSVANRPGEATVLPELHALRDWALTLVRHIAVHTLSEIPREEYFAESYGPDAYVTTILRIAEYAEDFGEMIDPGDARYPADLAGYTLPLFVPASVVETATRLLTGEGMINGFYASEASDSPWSYGSWYDDEPYEHPYEGHITRSSAHLKGFTDDEEELIYRAVLPRAAARDDARVNH